LHKRPNADATATDAGTEEAAGPSPVGGAHVRYAHTGKTGASSHVSAAALVGSALITAMSLSREDHKRSMRVTATGSVSKKARRMLEERNASHGFDGARTAGVADGVIVAETPSATCTRE